MRARLPLLAAAALVLGVAGAASSVWSALADGASGARAAQLSPPSGLTAARAPNGVQLAWSTSTSTFADAQQVLRSAAAAGPFTALAALPPSEVSYVDTAAGAGSWYYAMTAHAGSWSSASAVLERRDPQYFVRATSAFSGAPCPATGTTMDLKQGHVAPTGTGTAWPLGEVTLCTDAYSLGHALSAGTTTVNAYVVNAARAGTCTVDLAVLHNGTLVASGTGGVPTGGTALQALSWTVATPAVTFASGDRLALRITGRAFSKQTGNDCRNTELHGDGSLAPSNVVLTG